MCSTFATILIISVCLTLIGSGTYSCTYGSTTSHSDNSSDIAASPATRESSNSRAQNSSDLSTNIGSLTCIRSTTSKQQDSQRQCDDSILHIAI